MLYIHKLKDLSTKSADVESVYLIRELKQKTPPPFTLPKVQEYFAEFMISPTDKQIIEEAAKLLTPTTELVQSIMQDNDSIHEVVNIQRTLQILTELPGPLQINLNYINEMLAWQEQFINIFEKILRNKEFGFQDEDIISEAQISHIVGLNESLASGFLFHFTLEEELKKVDFETIKPRISQNRLQEDAVIRENVFKIRRGVERAYDINMRMVNLALVMYSYVKWLTSSSLNK